VLQLFGGYTYTDATIVESVNAANVGRPFANIPKHSANLLATVMLEGSCRGRRSGALSKQDFRRQPGCGHLPMCPAMSGLMPSPVSSRPNGEARVNVNNLTDKRYYDAIYRSGSPFAYIAPGRSAFLTLAVKM
jgi:catecholate siderophore receptor